MTCSNSEQKKAFLRFTMFSEVVTLDLLYKFVKPEIKILDPKIRKPNEAFLAP